MSKEEVALVAQDDKIHFWMERLKVLVQQLRKEQ